MKKTYSKPLMYYESFDLTEHITKTCGYVTNFGVACPVDEAHMTFFATVSVCDEDAITMWENTELPRDQWTIENLPALHADCYNSFADFTQLFNS